MRAVALAATGLLAAGAPGAAAQGQGEPPAPGGPGPGAPLVVIQPRDLRMNLAGVIVLRIGCSGNSGFCAGRLEASLAEPIRAPSSPGGPVRTWPPFLLGRAHYGVGAASSQVIRFRLFPRARYLVRLAGTIPVHFVGRPTSGKPGEQTIGVYVGPLQAFR